MRSMKAGQVGVGQSACGHGPKSIGQQVVLDGAVLLDLAIPTVVIGQKKPWYYHFRGAPAVEMHHSILQVLWLML